MLNLKQRELIQDLVGEIQTRFPEVQYLYVSPGPENPTDLWVHVTRPDDEDREIELIEFSANKAVDILINYGYHMLVMPVDRPLDGNELEQKRVISAVID